MHIEPPECNWSGMPFKDAKQTVTEGESALTLQDEITQALVDHGFKRDKAEATAYVVLETIRERHDIIPHAVKRMLHRLRINSERTNRN